jgi:hypothetical protein
VAVSFGQDGLPSTDSSILNEAKSGLKRAPLDEITYGQIRRRRILPLGEVAEVETNGLGDPVFFGINRGLCPVRGVSLDQDVRHVILDGAPRNEELLSDLRVGFPLR